MYCIDSIERKDQSIYFINEVKDFERDLVIMFHGFPDDSYGFDSQIEQLKKDYNIIVPFMHGTLNDTKVSEKRIAPREIILDVLALLKKFNPDEKRRVILMGHDLGCFTCVGALEVIPYQVKGLVHINGLGLQQFYSRKKNLSQWVKSYYVFLTQLSIVRFVVTKLFPNFFLNLIYKLSKVNESDSLYKNNSSVFRGINIYKHLFRKVFSYIGHPNQVIDTPTLFVWGNRDKFLDIPTRDEVDQFYNNAQIRVIVGGHWAHHSNPNQFNRILNNWMGRISE
jgi:pimeloyl-ACP methyl ester carboxylesterase